MVNNNILRGSVLIVFLIAVFLQVYLSKRKDKFSGLILPSVYFIRSLRSIFNFLQWANDIKTGDILGILLVQNIPTLIFITIYILCRRKINRDKEIEKMNIQDLE